MKSKFFKIFHSGEKPNSRRGIELETPTTPLSTDPVLTKETEPAIPPASKPELPQLIAACAQSVGKIRDNNEDSVFSMTTIIANSGGFLPAGLFIIADGMGGHQQGEVASDIAIRTVAREVIQKVILPYLVASPTTQEAGVQEILEASVLEAHRVISDVAPGSGTTLTAALVISNEMSIAHVGDSRLYLINSENEATVLTRDHSLVKRMIELGQLTEEEAAVHPQRNVLYRALGQGEPFSPDISSIPLPESGYLLLCSDGLWGLVSRSEIVRIVATNPVPEIAAQILVDAANEAGGSDNISVVLVKLPDYAK